MGRIVIELKGDGQFAGSSERILELKRAAEELEQLRAQLRFHSLENGWVGNSDEETVFGVIHGARAEAVDRAVGTQQEEERTLVIDLKVDGQSANVVAAFIGGG